MEDQGQTGYIELVRGNRNYRSLMFGAIVSLFGDWFNLIASAALISSLTGSGMAVGGLFVVRMLAPFLVSPLAGVAADRYNRKRLLIVADLSRAVVVLGFLLVQDSRQIWLLYLLTILQLAISGFFYPARNAILPEIVSRRELGAANALSSAIWSVMLALGAAVGGLVAGSWGIYPAFMIDAFTFLLSAVFIAQISYKPEAVAVDVASSLGAVTQDYLAGIQYLVKRFDLLVISLQKGAWALFIGGAFQVVQVVLAKQYFSYGEEGSASLGIMYAVVGVGTGLGPILARRLTGDKDHLLRILMTWAYVLGILGTLIIAPLASFLLVLLGILLRSVGSGINWVFSTQLLLQLSSERMRGRVFSTEFAVFTLASALGAALGGWVLDHTAFSLTTILLLIAVLALIPTCIWALWVLFGKRELPEEAQFMQAGGN